MKYFIVVIIIFTSCKTIDWQSQETRARKDRKGTLVGVINKQILQQDPYGLDWFNECYASYKTDKKIVSKLKILLQDIRIIVFMGVWCDDSRWEVPCFYRLLDEIGFDEKNIRMVALSKKKKAIGLQRGYNIKRVPTFIVYRNNKEIGRIVECPKYNSTLERDLLDIIAKR